MTRFGAFFGKDGLAALRKQLLRALDNIAGSPETDAISCD
jgi:hypothetical protein